MKRRKKPIYFLLVGWVVERGIFILGNGPYRNWREIVEK